MRIKPALSNMVSIEEEMIQRDKETAVLKANHKHQMLLNIELERIEKCRRTYESSYNFEVALMKARREKIALKQSELQRMKMDKGNNTAAWTGVKTYAEKTVGEKFTAGINVSRTNTSAFTPFMGNPSQEGTSSRSRHTHTKDGLKLKRQSLRSNPTRQRSKRDNKRTGITNVPFITRVTNNPNIDGNHAGRSLKALEAQHFIKLPGLTQSCSPDLFNFPTYHGRQKVAETYEFDARKLPSTVARNCNKKSARNPADYMSPFDRFRLKLQESEQRSRKYKPLLRSISAVDTLRKGGKIDDIIKTNRRARSADME